MTSIEWLAFKLGEHIIWEEKIIDLVEQAKLLHKQEIIDAYETSHISMMTSDQYYQETFLSKGKIKFTEEEWAEINNGSKGSDEHIVDTNEIISDEEIEKAALDYDNAVIYGPPLVHFEQGAFWYREQLKSRRIN
jgi:hypothetical protein